MVGSPACITRCQRIAGFLGHAPEIGLTGEQAGVLPGPEWLKVNYPEERWSSAYTANVSIGQGYDLVSPLQLVMAYSTVANGGTYFGPAVASLLRNVVANPATSNAPDFLTDREREVLSLIAEGLLNKQIADRLGIGVRTIETHRERIMRKLEIHTVAGLDRKSTRLNSSHT